MRCVRAVMDIPRDCAFSIVYEHQYTYPVAAQHNFNLVFEMFLSIDDSLVAAILRKIEEQNVERVQVYP